MLIGYVVMPRRGGYWVEYQEGKKRSIIAKCSSEKEAVRLMRARQDGPRTEGTEAGCCCCLAILSSIRRTAVSAAGRCLPRHAYISAEVSNRSEVLLPLWRLGYCRQHVAASSARLQDTDPV